MALPKRSTTMILYAEVPPATLFATTLLIVYAALQARRGVWLGCLQGAFRRIGSLRGLRLLSAVQRSDGENDDGNIASALCKY